MDGDKKIFKPPVKMVGEDGNAFAIIARVSKALKQAGCPGRAKEWMDAATSCESYNHLLNLVFEYADVDGGEEVGEYPGEEDGDPDDLGYAESTTVADVSPQGC